MKKENFIIIRVFGGLGNQLWQYALGRSLSLKYKKDLVLDLSFFKNSLIDLPKGFKSEFELDKFKIPNSALIESNFNNYSYRFFKYFINFLPNFLKIKFFKNKNYEITNFIFEEKLFKKKSFNLSRKRKESSYFIGYWQCKSYMKQNSEIIKKELKPKYIKNNVKKFLNKIKNNYVAIHIRGGDMSLEKGYTKPEKDFYFKIFDLLKNKNKNKNYYFHIFTDDLKFTKKMIKDLNLKNFTIISKTKEFSNIDEFYIMQHYKYFVISRSTFSWWAAYLGRDKNREIFAPKIWYGNKIMFSGIKLKNMTLV